MVFQKQLNEEGNYVDGQGVCYEILSCERTESKEWYDTGEVDEYGEPIWAQRVVINKGWDEFPDMPTALLAYGLEYSPKEEPTK